MIAKKGKLRFYGLIRDKDGKPRFNDGAEVPARVWARLTKEEQQEVKRKWPSLTILPLVMQRLTQ